MREFDLDSALRKFRDTTMFYQREWENGLVAPLEQMEVGYVRSIQPYQDYQVYTLDKGGSYVYTADPEYYQPPSGWYPSRNPGTLVLLTRRSKKTYKIGVCDENYTAQMLMDNGRLMSVSPHFKNIDFLAKFVIDNEQKEKSLETHGPITRTIWLQGNQVKYLGKVVGYRKGSTFFVNESVREMVGNALKNFNPRFVE